MRWSQRHRDIAANAPLLLQMSLAVALLMLGGLLCS